MKKLLTVIIMVFFGFIMLINYNNQFYTAAQSHKQLAKLTQYFRFDDKKKAIVQENKSEDEVFTGEVVDTENVKITQPVLDEHFLVFHKMIDDTAYFIEKSVGAAMIDPNHKIWRLKGDHFEEVLDIEKLNIYESEVYLNDYAIVGDDIYLSYADRDFEHFYIYHYSEQGSQLIHKGIYRHIYNSSNVPRLIQKGDKVYFSSFQKNLDRYILTFNCIENRTIESKMVRTYEDSLDPYDVPILRLVDLDHEYIVFSEVEVNVKDWQNHVDELETSYNILILNPDFSLMERVLDKDFAMIISEGVVSYNTDSFHFRARELPTSRYFTDIDEFYRHLLNEKVQVYSVSNGGALFDEFSILAKSITYLPENYPDTVQDVEHKHLFFTDRDSVLIVEREYGKREVELIKLNLK